MSRSQVESLPEVALARDLLRSWYGLELAVLGAAELREALASLGAPLASWRGAAVHRGDTGEPAVVATIAGEGEVAVPGALIARVARSSQLRETMAELHQLGGEAAALLATSPTLQEDELRRACDLVVAAARAIEAAAPPLTGLADVLASPRHPFLEMIGTSTPIVEVAKLVEKVARSHATALIHGESGTGKELVARAIHFHGPRAKKPFVVQNCSAFNDNLLESALFGHVRGAFTGAVKDQRGLFEAADGGTFFLDEIGDMSAALQVKLLRVLQEGTFTPVGGTKPLKVDVRVVAASHKDLAAMVARKEFREDLFYRINVLKISLPPLRERKSDIPLLVHHFLRKHRPGDARLPKLLPTAMAVLMTYAWPGNIRELENEIERMLVLAANAEELGPSLISARIYGLAQAAAAPAVPLDEVVRAAISQAITSGMVRAGGDRDTLARELGVTRAYVEAQCAAMGLDGR